MSLRELVAALTASTMPRSSPVLVMANHQAYESSMRGLRRTVKTRQIAKVDSTEEQNSATNSERKNAFRLNTITVGRVRLLVYP